MIFALLPLALVAVGATLWAVLSVRQADQERDEATLRCRLAQRERDRLRTSRWAHLRPMTAGEVARLAKTGHRRCGSSGLVRVVSGGVARQSLCACTSKRFELLVHAGVAAEARDGTICVVEPIGRAPSPGVA